MATIGHLLGTAARIEILRVLQHQPGSVGLRQAARVAGVHPHSAELALKSLVHDGLVDRRHTARGPRYGLARAHPDAAVIEAVFAAAARVAIRQRSESLQRRGRAVLPRIEEARQLLKRARGNRHVA